MLKRTRFEILLKQLMLDPGGVKVEVVSKMIPEPLHPFLLLDLWLGVLQVPFHFVAGLIPFFFQACLAREVAGVMDHLQLSKDAPTGKHVHSGH